MDLTRSPRRVAAKSGKAGSQAKVRWLIGTLKAAKRADALNWGRGLNGNCLLQGQCRTLLSSHPSARSGHRAPLSGNMYEFHALDGTVVHGRFDESSIRFQFVGGLQGKDYYYALGKSAVALQLHVVSCDVDVGHREPALQTQTPIYEWGTDGYWTNTSSEDCLAISGWRFTSTKVITLEDDIIDFCLRLPKLDPCLELHMKMPAGAIKACQRVRDKQCADYFGVEDATEAAVDAATKEQGGLADELEIFGLVENGAAERDAVNCVSKVIRPHQPTPTDNAGRLRSCGDGLPSARPSSLSSVASGGAAGHGPEELDPTGLPDPLAVIARFPSFEPDTLAKVEVPPYRERSPAELERHFEKLFGWTRGDLEVLGFRRDMNERRRPALRVDRALGTPVTNLPNNVALPPKFGRSAIGGKRRREATHLCREEEIPELELTARSGERPSKRSCSDHDNWAPPKAMGV